MEVKFDFRLNDNLYGVVEQAIFRLVLRGIDSAQAISDVLWVFSDEVKATSIQKLVNNQLLRAELKSNRLALSDGLLSIIEACHAGTYSLDLPDSLMQKMIDDTIWIEDRQLISIILKHILPSINMEYIVKSLAFSMTIARYDHET